MLEKQAAEVLTKLVEGIESSAPGALDLALRAMQLNATLRLSMAGAVLAFFLLTLLFVPRKLRAWAEDYPHDEFPAMAGLAYGVAVLIGTIGCLTQLLDTTLWMTAVDPRLGLAHQVVERLFSK